MSTDHKWEHHGGQKWRKFARKFLWKNPLCARCRLSKRDEPATDADHILPARKYPALAFETSNLQPLCRPCHSYKSVKYERKGLYPDYARQVVYRESEA